MITEERVRDELRTLVEIHGGQTKLADLLGISQSFLSKLISGKYPIPEKISDKLGLERVVCYKKKQPE